MSGPRAWFWTWRVDDAGVGAQPTGGQQVGQDVAADGAGQVDGGGGGDACCLDELVAGGVPGDGEAGPVGVGAGAGAGGVGHGGAQELVGDQESVDSLGEAGGVRARRTRPPRMVDLSSR